MGENSILEFFRDAIKHPQELKEHLKEMNLNDRARLLAFLQMRDKDLYSKVEKLT